MVKEPLAELKFAIFKNWLDTRQKMETHEPKPYPTKSARFQVPKNGTSSAQIFERTPKTPRNTPQNGGVYSWFMRFHFRASIKPIFENCKF